MVYFYGIWILSVSVSISIALMCTSTHQTFRLNCALFQVLLLWNIATASPFHVVLQKKFLTSIDACTFAHCKPFLTAVNKLLTVQCHTVINQGNSAYFFFSFEFDLKDFGLTSNFLFSVNIWIFYSGNQMFFTILIKYGKKKICVILVFFIFPGPKNYNGLLMRAEVLYRLGHFRSSLADADNAIKCRPTSYNVSMTSSLLLSHRRTINPKLALKFWH